MLHLLVITKEQYIYFAPALQLKSFMMNEQLKRIEMPSSFHVVCPLEENI